MVALSFEEADQLADRRGSKFIKQYGIKYTVLLDGETSTAKDTLRRPSTGTPGPRHSSLPLHLIKLQERIVQSPLTHCRSHRIAPYHRHSLVERPFALVVVPYREQT